MAFILFNRGNKVFAPRTTTNTVQVDRLSKPQPVHEQASRTQREIQAYQEQPRKILPTRAGQIMSTPVTFLPMNATATDAWQEFKQTHFRYLPVVDQQSHLTGILSERDLLFSLIDHTAGKQLPDNLDNIIKHRVLSATEDTDIRQLAFTMQEQKLGAMPIVDQHNYLVGIITRSDLLKLLSTYGSFKLQT